MPDIATVSALIGSVKTAIDIGKSIRDTATSLEQAELNLKVADLLNALADTKTEVAELQLVLQEKDKEIAALTAHLEVRESVTWEAPYYFIQKGETREGPFCQQCYDSDSKLIRLQGSITSRGEWRCRTCRSVYHDSNFKDPSFSEFSGL